MNNMLNKNINHEKPKDVIATGVKIGDRLNLIKSRGMIMNAVENHYRGVPKKINLSSELTKKLTNAFDTNKKEENNMENGTKIDKNEDNNNKNNENKEIETTKGTEHTQIEENKRDEEQNNNDNQENKNEAENQEINEENNKKAEDLEKENEKNEDNIEENKESLKDEQQNNIEENEHQEEAVEEEHPKNEKENIEENNEEITKEELNQVQENNDEQNKEQSPQNEETEEKKEEEEEKEVIEEEKEVKKEEKEVKEEEKEVKEEEKEVKEEEKEVKEEKLEVKEEKLEVKEEKLEEKEEKIEGNIQEENNQQIEGEQIEGEKKKIEDEQEKNKEEIITEKEITQDEVKSDTKNQEENEEYDRDSVLKIDNETKEQQLKGKEEDEYLSLKKGKSIEEILGVQDINEKQKDETKIEDYQNKQQRTSNLKRSFCFKEDKNINNKSDLKEYNDAGYPKFQDSFNMNFLKSGTVSLEQEMKFFNQKKKEDKRKNSFSKKRNTLEGSFDFEIVDDDDLYSEDCPTFFLESINYENYLSDLKSQGIKESPRETFCEGFFIASFPKKQGKVIEKSENLPSQCGHEECSRLPSMKPEIIMRYPLKDTKNLELNNLAATICFPTGIKLCYSEKTYPKKFEGYVTQITNTKGERYYMRTFHFYHKIKNIDMNKEYDLHPLKHKLQIFGDNYLVLNEDEYTDDITNNIQENLKFCEELGFREYVYIPYCICLISKYSYTKELEICLDTIFKIMAHEPNKLNFEINELIMYLIHSVPIPLKSMRVRFYIPFNNTKLELLCPKIDDVSTMNSKLTSLFDYLSVDNIILVFRLLLSEKKILFIHDDYTELTNYIDSFISILYPFKWIHTFIPIMSDQMMKVLLAMLPFLNGIHTSLMKFVEDVFNDDDFDDTDEVFLIKIKEDKIDLSSSLKNNKEKKIKLSKYVQNNVLPLPFEKELKKELKSIESSVKSLKRESKQNNNISKLETKMRDAFIDVFVKMFHDYEKYIGILDNDVIFNKVLFMNSISKDESFYNEFIESQLFNYFTQNLLLGGYSYFNKKIKEFKQKKNKKNHKEKNRKDSINNTDTIYLTCPDYLGIKENDRILIEKTVKDNYNIKGKETVEMKNNILGSIRFIDPEKYINSKCIIYLIPEKKETPKDEENILDELSKKMKSTSVSKGKDSTEKQREQIKDDIKDLVIKIFKSEIVKEDNYNTNKNFISILQNLETDDGRNFFVSLISNNSNNIVSLEEESFKCLDNLITHILNSSLKLEESDQLIEEIVILIKSTKYFKKEPKKDKKDKKDKKEKREKKDKRDKKDKQDKKENEMETLFNIMKKRIQNYSKIGQKNIWEKWYELELKKKDIEEQNDNNIKSEVLFSCCKDLIELEIGKGSVKNIADTINKNLFGENTELFGETQKKYIEIITQSNYISKIKNI